MSRWGSLEAKYYLCTFKRVFICIWVGSCLYVCIFCYNLCAPLKTSIYARYIFVSMGFCLHTMRMRMACPKSKLAPSHIWDLQLATFWTQMIFQFVVESRGGFSGCLAPHQHSGGGGRSRQVLATCMCTMRAPVRPYRQRLPPSCLKVLINQVLVGDGG